MVDIEKCPVKRGLSIFEGKWNARIIYELIQQPTMRFGELNKAIPEISNTMLATTLKGLEEKGIVKRIQFNEIPPHVEYSLTESGLAIIPVFDAIGEWGEKYTSVD
ncbi:winged helix-turn-helix transcriptional regulator [Konateibacter massiliensis]|uniref:winged helix-turn-helix transcriptional regulator n=1 Tax=Konateibacter massiliensis TaxID=2002841 RepID=UPI000C151D7B|nr:helix-turn-helix domain-containing protein [Konateibacter massiliensis]